MELIQRDAERPHTRTNKAKNLQQPQYVKGWGS